ncbi:unnamed protein product [Linum tenue]|uniref:Peptidase M41 FtsH extracellular domain-containing protein n=1 Tax=Linum tenue TaxID=586396 RepID=A0AAV0LGH6_9ROSI|nr:unnamed protein product [Linum tenue]
MIFSKLSRSSRGSSFSKWQNISRGGCQRSAITGVPQGGSFVNRIDDRVGFLRSYLTSIGAAKSSGAKNSVSNLNGILANPRLRRFFSSEAPKNKNYENFYPKGKKEAPKGNGQKSESKENSNEDDEWIFQKMFAKQFNLLSPLLVIGVLLSSFPFGSNEHQHISFQEFKNKLLEPGLVDHIVVSNKLVAKVYVKSANSN